MLKIFYFLLGCLLIFFSYLFIHLVDLVFFLLWNFCCDRALVFIKIVIDLVEFNDSISELFLFVFLFINIRTLKPIKDIFLFFQTLLSLILFDRQSWIHLLKNQVSYISDDFMRRVYFTCPIQLIQS
jgi:hypothetical protein